MENSEIMAKGRKRLPAKIKAIRGTLQPCRTLPNEVDYAVLDDVTPPEMLDAIGKKEWIRIVKILKDKRIITEADVFALIQYCHAYSLQIQIIEKVRFENLIMKDKAGGPLVNPYQREFYKLNNVFNSISARFGFSPADRTKILMPEKFANEKNIEDDFIRRAI